MINGVGFHKINALKSDTFVRTVFYHQEVPQMKLKCCTSVGKYAKGTSF